MLRDHDKSAVFALVVRQVEAQQIRISATAAMEAAKESIAKSSADMANIRIALSLFGFDMSEEKPWEAIQAALGPDFFQEAIDTGYRMAAERDARVAAMLESRVSEEEPPAVRESKTATSMDSTTAAARDDGQLKVRDIVLDRLLTAGDAGIKASTIKEYIAALGINTHEKTVGMTLYRLAQDGLARRVGWIWYPLRKADKEEAADAQSWADTSTASDSNPEQQGREAGPGGGT